MNNLASVFLTFFFTTAPTVVCFAAGGPPTTGGPPPGGLPPGAGVAAPARGPRGPPPGIATGAGGPREGPRTWVKGPVSGMAAPGGLEDFFEKAWPVLYAFDDKFGIQDSSKNLRVLWTRALLSNLDKIRDNVAYDLLPRGTRRIVGPLAAKTVWSGPLGRPAVDKLDWIINRTNFIDAQLSAFLEETVGTGEGQVIVLGAGYDTRSIRFQRSGLKFFEIDSPDVSSAKESMMKKYISDRQNNIVGPTYVGFDLNEIATQKTSLSDILEKKGLDLDESVPTMVICEAVLFYLMPEAVQGLVEQLFALPNARRYCLTDNLSKLGVAPGPPVPSPKEKCKKWLEKEGKALIDHDAIWGGAIHFVAAK